MVGPIIAIGHLIAILSSVMFAVIISHYLGMVPGFSHHIGLVIELWLLIGVAYILLMDFNEKWLFVYLVVFVVAIYYFYVRSDHIAWIWFNQILH
jgi:hypothetical protein